MPNCFQLSKKSSPTFEPIKLSVLDDEICAYMGVEPDEIKYYCGWYDYIGFRLAMGNNFDQIKASLNEWLEDVRSGKSGYTGQEQEDMQGHIAKLMAINTYLQANYVSNAWAEVGRQA
jgi:hypothetical protein